MMTYSYMMNELREKNLLHWFYFDPYYTMWSLIWLKNIKELKNEK